MTLGTVHRLSRYPVKSMLGEDLGELAVDGRGAVGDRLWAVTYDDGKLGSGKSSSRFRRTDGLLHFSAAYVEGRRPAVTVPDGGPLRDDAHLSELLGAPVRLAREDDRADGWTHFDDGPVSLATTASLRALGELLGESGPVDRRRFRKNILLDTAEPWIEESWPGREIAIGDEVRLRIDMRLPRCVMTTMAQSPSLGGGALPHDSRILKTVAEERENCIGLVADVITPGVIRIGDTARFS